MLIGVGVGLAVGVTVGVSVAVGLGAGVGLALGIGVTVTVGVAVGVGMANDSKTKTQSLKPSLLFPGWLKVTLPLLANGDPAIDLYVLLLGSNQRALAWPESCDIFTVKAALIGT